MSEKSFWQEHGNKVLGGVLLMGAGAVWSLLGGGLTNWVDGRVKANPEVQSMAEVREKVISLEIELRTQNKLLLRLLPPAPGD